MTKVTIDRALIEQACEAHRAMREWIKAAPEPTIPMPGTDGDWLDDVEGMLSQALAEPAVEPVAWRVHPATYGVGHDGVYALTTRTEQVDVWRRKGWDVEPLYTSPPPPAEPARISQDVCTVPLLSDEEIHNADPCPHSMFDSQRIEFARAIEQLVRRKAGL